MKRAALIALAVSLAASLPASAALKKYKDWASSPEAYFLTADEKKAWAEVGSDEDAEKFIKAYQSARGGGFAAAIQSRIDFADRTLGLGKKKGSTTMRGKTLVLLGAPTRVSASTSGNNIDLSKVDIAALDGRSTGGGANSSGSSNPSPYTNSGSPGDALRLAHAPDSKTTQIWVYQAGVIPVGDKTKDVPFAFTIDQNSGTEVVTDQAKVDQLFEQVVAYWAPKK